MGLNDIHKFNPEDKIIEYVMEKDNSKEKRLKNLSLYKFMNLTASEAPVPGGGSASAYMGALGTALGTMVANLSSHKKGWDERWQEFSQWAEQGKKIQNELLMLVDEDTDAYRGIMKAYALPGKTDEEKALRKVSVSEATKIAMLVPFKVMKTAFSAFPLIREMVEKGNPNSITDAGVGALALHSCIKGAYLNVRINAAGLNDEGFSSGLISEGAAILLKTSIAEAEIINIINEKIDLLHFS